MIRYEKNNSRYAFVRLFKCSKHSSENTSLKTVKHLRVRGLPKRRLQVLVCGTGRGLDNDAGFAVVVHVRVLVRVVPSA